MSRIETKGRIRPTVKAPTTVGAWREIVIVEMGTCRRLDAGRHE